MSTLKIGAPAPDFALPDQDGVIRTLREFQGRKLALFFYPRANTPGCTTQACAMRDARDDLHARGVHVLGVSPDTSERQGTFAAKFSFGYPLLADTERTMAEAYGVWGEKTVRGKKTMGIIRSAFLIDEKGVLRGAWLKISPKDTVPTLLAALDGQ